MFSTVLPRVSLALIVSAGILTGLVVQSYRLYVVKEELASERLISQSLSIQVQALQERNKAMEKALLEREANRQQLQQQYEVLRKRLRNATESTPEAKAWASRPIPGDVVECLRNQDTCGSSPVPGATPAPSTGSVPTSVFRNH